MNSIADVSFSGLVARNCVEWLKTKGWVKSKLGIMLSSIVINLLTQVVLSVADSVSSGQRLSLILVRAAFGTVVSSVYHDWKKSLDTTK